MAGNGKETVSAFRWMWGVLLLPLCLFVTLSLFSYDWKDIGILIQPPNLTPTNLIGPVGAWMAYIMFFIFGLGAYLVPLWCLIFGVVLIFGKKDRVWPRAVWGFVMILALAWAAELNQEIWSETCKQLNISDTGGIFGRIIMGGMLVKWLSPVGAGILIWSLFTVSVVMFIGIKNITAIGLYLAGLCRRLYERVMSSYEEKQDNLGRIEKRERDIEKERRRLEKTIQKQERIVKTEKKKPVEKKIERPAPAPAKAEKKKERKRESIKELFRKEKKKSEPALVAAKRPAIPSDFNLPSLDLLTEAPASKNKGIHTDTATTSKVIIETLNEFGIEAEIIDVQKGPVVTRYELLPAPGVRVEKIAGLSNNLALSLKATSVRVQAPIPGKGAVGIEVPNTTANIVYLKQMLEGDVWRAGSAILPLVLGKDVGGNDIIGDLTKMPHLLIAGATGSGKTVCMNSILAGLLMSRTPDELRLMLIDPKIVEFSGYNNLPHLVVPVITDAKKVALALSWAINEMEKRYKLFAKVGVRNIEAYNHREITKQEELFDGAAEEKGNEPPERIPYIVIIIDELADLMLAAQAEIENRIARLAQLSRAVGIHMILATQRPSVNVITGTIKANFPARIAFQVAQKVDSRTILDASGAEKLLGNGDMLYMPPGSSKLIRVQGGLTSDKEIKDIVAFLKEQGQPDYVHEIKQKMEKQTMASVDGYDSEDEEMLEKAIAVIKETQRASTSSLQRRLRIGYTRAARIMDILEERGIIGPPRGSDPREILVDLDGDIPNNSDEDIENDVEMDEEQDI